MEGLKLDASFQSTPVIANGRIFLLCLERTKNDCFNPRPLLLTGESYACIRSGCIYVVSIHARYC